MKKITAAFLAMLLLFSLQSALAAEDGFESRMISAAKEAAARIAAAEAPDTAFMQALAKELGVDEICATDDKGVVRLSTVPEYIGYDMASDAQSAYFLPLLSDSALTLSQEPSPLGFDKTRWRQFFGVAGGLTGGLTQVALRVDAPVIKPEYPADFPQFAADYLSPGNTMALVDIYLTDSETMLGMPFALDSNWGVSDYGLQVEFMQSLTDALLALQNGRATLMATLYDTARYVANRNDSLVIRRTPCANALHFITSEKNADMLKSLNAALNKFKDDGTMEALWRIWVEDVIAGDDPAPIALPSIEGATTLRVGVSGDMPPMDYVAADGSPAGFNVAVLGRLSEEMGVNIRLVPMDGNSRALALYTDKIDLFFWHATVDQSVAEHANITQEGYEQVAEQVKPPEGLLLSDPYAILWQGVVMKQK